MPLRGGMVPGISPRAFDRRFPKTRDPSGWTGSGDDSTGCRASASGNWSSSSLSSSNHAVGALVVWSSSSSPNPFGPPGRFANIDSARLGEPPGRLYAESTGGAGTSPWEDSRSTVGPVRNGGAPAAPPAGRQNAAPPATRSAARRAAAHANLRQGRRKISALSVSQASPPRRTARRIPPPGSPCCVSARRSPLERIPAL